MHAVQRRHAAALDELRRGHVRRDHAFLDQPVRVVALVQLDCVDLPARRS
jgi:hypothetical protein